MADYTITTTETEEAALAAHIERENANAPSLGQAPWADTAAYMTDATRRLVLDPLTSLYIEAVVVKLGKQARQATLAQLQAADDALPEVP